MEMMNNNKRDGWVQISSTLAVLIGVALVIMELRQNSDLIEFQILKQDAESADDRLTSLLPQNIWEIRQKSIDDPENLTHMEYRAMDGYLWAITVNRWRSLYDLQSRDFWKRRYGKDPFEKMPERFWGIRLVARLGSD